MRNDVLIPWHLEMFFVCIFRFWKVFLEWSECNILGFRDCFCLLFSVLGCGF